MEDLNLVIPKDSGQYPGEFIVFFSDEKDSNILFHSIIADDAYKESQRIKKETGKDPVVIRVPEKNNEISAQVSIKNV